MDKITRLKTFLVDEGGNSSVEMAILFPIIIMVVMFITDRFILYEGLTVMTTTVNEAVRYGIVQDDTTDAVTIIQDTLEEQFKAQKMGWCSGDEVSTCREWKADDPSQGGNLTIEVTNDEWCYGHYLTVEVEAHKASLFPSYSNFRKLITEGGPVYHTHKYRIKARIESSRECSDNSGLDI